MQFECILSTRCCHTILQCIGTFIDSYFMLRFTYILKLGASCRLNTMLTMFILFEWQCNHNILEREKKWTTYWLFVLKTVRSNYFPTFQHFIEIQLENALPLGLSTFESVGYAIRSISLNKCIRRVRAMNSIWHFERVRVCRRVYIIIRFVSYKLQSNESNRKCSANWLFWITVFKTPAAILCSFKSKSGLPKAWLIDYSTDFSPPNTTKFQQFYYFLPYNDCSANFHVLNNLHQKLSIWSRKRHTESGAWS